MAQSTTDSWLHLIEQKQTDFAERALELPPVLANESSFRTVFERLCRSRSEFAYTRLLSKLNLGSIYAFVRTVDATFYHVAPSSLAALLSAGCFIAVEVRSIQLTLG